MNCSSLGWMPKVTALGQRICPNNQMNQSTSKPEPEQPRMSTEERESLVRDFFRRELLPRMEETDEDELVSEGVIVFAREAAPTGFVLSEDSAAETWGILHACVREHEPLALPGNEPVVKPSKKRKKKLMPDSLLTIQNVMDRIQMSENFVYGLVQKGHLKAVYLSARALRVFPDSVDGYINSRVLPTR